MSNTALNDMKYNFEPLILFQPKSDYKVDEQELKKSINKSKELIARIQKKKTVQPTTKQAKGVAQFELHLFYDYYLRLFINCKTFSP